MNARYHPVRMFLSWAVTWACLLISVGGAYADSWPEPDVCWFYSKDKGLAAKVIPAQWAPAQVAMDTSTGETSFLGRNMEKVPRGLEIRKQDLDLQQCTARVYTKESDGTYREILAFELANRVLPADFVISDSGRYFATTDNWGSYGYGGDVVVVYDGAGKLLFKYGLEDMLGDAEIAESVEQTVSSRIWLKGRPDIDEKSERLMIPTRKGMRVISLATGKVSKNGN